MAAILSRAQCVNVGEDTEKIYNPIMENITVVNSYFTEICSKRPNQQ